MLKRIVVFLCLLLWPINFLINFSGLEFKTETIFKRDYQAEQLILRNIQLYPTPLLARIFQNKGRIYFDKYMKGFFTLSDPNYYFFALHPTPIPGAVNMSKFPFLSILFFIAGLAGIKNSKYSIKILRFLIAALLFLPVLTNFEGWDFILFFPISLIIFEGIKYMESMRPTLFKYFAVIFILFSLPELLRIFFIK
jgi:hypothetical protein